jgi:general secretion pathway protein L
MNIKDLLNADLQTVSQWIRQGLTWWADELVALVPIQWRKRFAARPNVVVEFGEQEISARGAGGRAVDLEALTSRERDNATVVLPLRNVLTRVLDYPLLPLADARRMIALDIDRLTPFRADAVFFDVELVRRETDKARQQLLLGVVPRDVLSDIMTRARALGLHPLAIGASGGAGSNIHFDFLPALRGAGRASGARGRVPYWWVAVGVLMAVNVALLSYRDSSDIDTLQQNVDSQQGPVQVALRLRAKIGAEADRRTALIQRQANSAPLRIIAAVTKALPQNVWTQRFEWNGQSVHLAGYSNGPADLLRALEKSPLLHNARTMSGAVQRPRANGTQPFEVVADARKGAAR